MGTRKTLLSIYRFSYICILNWNTFYSEKFSSFAGDGYIFIFNAIFIFYCLFLQSTYVYNFMGVASSIHLQSSAIQSIQWHNGLPIENKSSWYVRYQLLNEVTDKQGDCSDIYNSIKKVKLVIYCNNSYRHIEIVISCQCLGSTFFIGTFSQALTLRKKFENSSSVFAWKNHDVR